MGRSGRNDWEFLNAIPYTLSQKLRSFFTKIGDFDCNKAVFGIESYLVCSIWYLAYKENHINSKVEGNNKF